MKRVAALVALAPLAPLASCTSSSPWMSEEIDTRLVGHPRDPAAVPLFTHDTSPPDRPSRIVARYTARIHKPWAFGFEHLRELRERAAALGCDAVLVGPPELEADRKLCPGRADAPPVACIERYDARCVRFLR